MPTTKKIKRPWIKESLGLKGMKDNKFYHSSQWRKCRKAGLIQEPLCRECKKKGKITPATIRDHIIPINPINGFDTMNGKYPNPLDMTNQQSMCKSCHYSKMAKASNK